MPQQRKLIWFALVMSVVIYVVMAYLTSQENVNRSFDEAVRTPLTLPMYAMSVAMFAVATVMAKRPQVGWMTGLALYESCAIFALVAAFINKDWRLVLPGAALALVGMIRLYPGETEASPGSV